MSINAVPARAGRVTVMGVMSGTSLDGISAAIVRFAPGRGELVDAELVGFHTVPYTVAQRARLESALAGASPAAYCRLRVDLGHWLADAALPLMEQCGVAADSLDAIASHGQTVWHEPGHSTWQIGDPSTLAERTGVAVIHDFRSRDVAAGGQGAPLVPMADRLLFSHPTRWRALQNLGGIGNVTVVPPAGRAEGLLAFDTGPGVAVVDAVFRALQPGLPFDVGGRLASSGRAVAGVVDELLTEPYFHAPPPKSTGRELFSASYAARLVDRCRAQRPRCSDADLLATAVSLTARSIGMAYARWVPPEVDEVILSGGGARNDALVHAIGEAVTPRRVSHFAAAFFDGDAREAVAFALLGYLYLMGRPGNVPSATGARGPRVLGSFTPA